jgi:hypothetical protein
MKKLFFIAVLVISMTSLKAQSTHFGAKLGVNSTTMSISGDSAEMEKYSDGKYGLSVGLVGDFMLSEQFAVSGEINYAMAGDVFSLDDAKITYYLSYIQIPVMAKYFINESFYLNAGPQIGFLMSADGEAEYNGSTDSQDVKDEFESTDFGLNIGAGYKFDNGLFLDLRYSAGLSDIVKEEETTAKNNGFLFSVGYFFN